MTTSGGVPPTNAVCSLGYNVSQGISSIVTEISGCSLTKPDSRSLIVEPSDPVRPFQKARWMPPEPSSATTFVGEGAGVGVAVGLSALTLSGPTSANTIVATTKTSEILVNDERLNICFLLSKNYGPLLVLSHPTF